MTADLLLWGEVQESVKEFLVRDLKQLGYQLIDVNLLVSHAGWWSPAWHRGLVIRVVPIAVLLFLPVAHEYPCLVILTVDPNLQGHFLLGRRIIINVGGRESLRLILLHFGFRPQVVQPLA
jgi:hypothetical protein